jgi:hypothetical protein
VLASACSPPAGSSIDETKLVPLVGNTNPSAKDPANDAGLASDSLVLEHMQLVLRRSPELQAELDARIEALQDRSSPQYHQWLTPTEFADAYGVPASDVAVVTDWLGSHGFHIDGVADNRMFIEFTGNAGQVRETFHTEIHRLSVAGVDHIANTSDPSIPEELARIVVGAHAFHDFMPHALVKSKVNPDFTVVNGTSTYYTVAPADFATIYNLNPLFARNIRGAGQTIAVIEDTKIKNASDVSTFRSAFGLSSYAGTFSQVVETGTAATCTDPGVNSDESEAALDAEWAGAAAPDAAIQLAACADTITVFGGLIAVQNMIAKTTHPQIVSISYGECESANGAAANQSYVNAYQQAVAEGISVFVSSGDEGAASCDANQSVASHGITVSGFASTPYNVAVGGTDFADDYDKAKGGPAMTTYWSATNTSGTLQSAHGYIPEIPWNDACDSQLIYSTNGYTQGYGSTGFCNSSAGRAKYLTTTSASGGPSSYSTQPSWQTGVVGLPTSAGGPRYLPDVSLFAANGVWTHFYVYCMTDNAQGGAPCNYSVANDVLANGAGGTSFSAPALAGIQALINQQTGYTTGWGNPNPTYYQLAASEYGASGSASCNSNRGTPAAPVAPDASCTFYDVTLGDIDVPCSNGTSGCFGSAKNIYGALSTSTTTLGVAYPAATGWDYATGLGTINATNLVSGFDSVIPACGSTTLTASPSSPRAINTSITLTASTPSGCPHPQYSFYERAPGGTWQTVQGWGSANTFAFSSGTQGTYYFQVWERDVSSGAPYQGYASLTFTLYVPSPPCASATLSAAPGSPQPLGTSITLSSTSGTCLNPQYAFYEKAPGGSWQLVQPYSSSATLPFQTMVTDPAGTYDFQVWVRDLSSSAAYDTVASTSVAEAGGFQPCANATLSASPGSPQTIGTPVTLSSTSQSCPNPQYAFYELAPGGTWQLVQDYSSSATFPFHTLATDPTGAYTFQVWVRDASSDAFYDTSAQIGFQETP